MAQQTNETPSWCDGCTRLGTSCNPSTEALCSALYRPETEHTGPWCSTCGREINSGVQCALCIEIDELELAPDTIEDEIYESLDCDIDRR
jgi:hypothetical protein